jgi:hypothetical protein
MNKAVTTSPGWYRIIIDDPQLAMSPNFRWLLETAMKHVPSSVVKAARLEIVPNAATESLMSHGHIHTVRINDLFDALASVTQLVWGRFFFFANNDDAEKANEDELAQSIATSQMTICVVDNASCFVFTKSASLVCELLVGPWRLEVIKDDLSRILTGPEDF